MGSLLENLSEVAQHGTLTLEFFDRWFRNADRFENHW